MSSFSSIYQKACPQCMSGNLQDCVQCACGYRFDDGQASPDQTFEDEKLYEAYLTARVDQAKQEFECAQKVYELEPSNNAKKASAAKARDVWERAEVEASEQRKRTEAVGHLAPAKAPAPAQPGKKTQPPVPPGVYVHPVPRLIRREGQTNLDPATSAVSAKVVESEPKRSVDATAPKKATDKHPAAPHCPRCGNTLNASAKCSCTERSFVMSEEMAKLYPSLYQAYLQNAESSAPVRPEQRRSSEASNLSSATPLQQKPASVRAAQAGAHISATSQEHEPAKMNQRVERTPAPLKATSQQNMQSGTEAARPLRTGDTGIQRAEAPKMPTKECPHCTAELPVLARACKCGMTFPDNGHVTSMPGLTLDPGELTQQGAVTTSPKECQHCTAVLPGNAKSCKCGMTFPEDGQVTVMPGLSLAPGEAIRLRDLYRR